MDKTFVRAWSSRSKQEGHCEGNLYEIPHKSSSSPLLLHALHMQAAQTCRCRFLHASAISGSRSGTEIRKIPPTAPEVWQPVLSWHPQP